MKNKIYLEKNYNKIIKDYDIKRVSPKIDVLKRFIKNELIVGHWNLDKVIKSYKVNKSIAIVTGFSLSGKLHLGNKLVIDIVNGLSRQGAKLFIPISDTEAILTRKRPKNIKTDFNNLISDLLKIGVDTKKTEIYLHSNNDKVQYLLLRLIKYLKISDFSKVYCKDIDLPEIFAISNMMADVFYPLEKSYNKILIILGVDEIKHAQLVKLLSKRLRMPEPSFLFVKILNGLKNDKMSKSKSKENILISDKPVVVKNKLIKSSQKRRFKDILDEPSYQIARWHLNIQKNELNKLSKDLSYNEFVKYVSNKLERYFKNGLR